MAEIDPDIGTVGDLVAQLLEYPQDKQLLFEDDSKRLFGLFSIRGDNPCHVTVELTELDKEATHKECSN